MIFTWKTVKKFTTFYLTTGKYKYYTPINPKIGKRLRWSNSYWLVLVSNVSKGSEQEHTSCIKFWLDNENSYKETYVPNKIIFMNRHVFMLLHHKHTQTAIAYTLRPVKWYFWDNIWAGRPPDTTSSKTARVRNKRTNTITRLSSVIITNHQWSNHHR